MISPEVIQGVIEKVEEWSSDELVKNVNEVLPTLTLCLSKVEQKSLCLRSINILLDRCLQCVPISKIDSDILQYALPTARNIFNEALEGVTVVLQDADHLSDEEIEMTLRSLHHVCLGLLEQVKNTLLYLKTQCPLPAGKVASVPSSVLLLLENAFVYCRDSEEMYGSSRELLIEMFESCCSILSCLEPLLLSGIQFPLGSKDDETLLVKVMESLVAVAKVTTNLGIRAQTLAWKMYVMFIERYSSSSHVWSSSDLCSPLVVLASSTSDFLSLILKSPLPENTVVVKMLAVLSFLVRILTRLCKVFAGHLTDHCMPSIFNLLCILQRCNIEGLEREVDPVILEEAKTRIGVASSSLFSCLINDRAFVQVYFSMAGRKINSELSLDWLLLSANLCESLISADAETRRLWTSNCMDNIFQCIFQLMSPCHPELCSDLKFSISSSGKGTRYADLYEYILTPVGALMLLVPADHFHVIEKLLLQHLGGNDPWKAVFVMDLWCIIARQSPSSVRMNHASLLLELLTSQEYTQCSPAQVHLRILFSRLWVLLPSQMQLLLLNKYPPVKTPEVWDGVCLKVFHENVEMNNEYLKVIEAIENFFAAPKPEFFEAMVKKLNLSVILLSAGKDCAPDKQVSLHLTSLLSNLWQLVCTPLLDFSDEGWLMNFIDVLVRLTTVLFPVLNNSNIFEVLEKCLVMVNNSLIHLKLKVFPLLFCLAEKRIEDDTLQHNIFQLIANIFITSMEDKNQVVQQCSFEAFVYFAHVTNHEEVVKICLKSKKIVQDRIAQYLKEVPVECKANSEGVLFADYLKKQCLSEFSHMCVEKKNKICPHVPKVSKKLKLDAKLDSEQDIFIIPNAELQNTIERLQKDSQYILNYCRKTNFDMFTREKVLKDLNVVKQNISNTHLLLLD